MPITITPMNADQNVEHKCQHPSGCMKPAEEFLKVSATGAIIGKEYYCEPHAVLSKFCSRCKKYAGKGNMFGVFCEKCYDEKHLGNSRQALT